MDQDSTVCDVAGHRVKSVLLGIKAPFGGASAANPTGTPQPQAQQPTSPDAPTEGMLIPSYAADQPDTLSSSLGSAVPACQESRSRVFYGWLLATLVGPASPTNGSGSSGKYRVSWPLALKPSTKAPCGLHTRALDDRGAGIENRFMDSVGDLSECQDRRPMRTVTGVLDSDDGLKRGQDVRKVLTLLTSNGT